MDLLRKYGRLDPTEARTNFTPLWRNRGIGYGINKWFWDLKRK